MENITLSQIHKDLLALKKEVAHIRVIVDEEYELSDHVVAAVEGSRKRSRAEFVSNDEMRAEFGA